ncbi:MAG: DUF1570 domain-containing protein [Prevotellaceae bacterium]|jgi:hypothetical protein|nr:DUF1570 domain-containing protein [Prevotellaceae bacterium]
MKNSKSAFGILLLLLSCAGVLAQEEVRIQDPGNHLSKKEKRTFERAISYEAAFYNRIFSDKKISFSDVKLTIIHNHIDFVLYLRSLGQAVPKNSPGVYLPSIRELIVCSDKKFKKGFTKITCHELSHAFLHLHSGDKNIPAWLNEGLAVYLQEMMFDRKKVKHRINNHYIARVKTLIELKDLNLSELIAWNYQKFSTESFAMEGYGYATGYCMTLFLMQRDEDSAIAIFRNLVGERTTVEVFDEFYAGGFGQFEKDFTEYFGK